MIQIELHTNYPLEDNINLIMFTYWGRDLTNLVRLSTMAKSITPITTTVDALYTLGSIEIK